MKDSTFLKRVVLKNYKSIAACDVSLVPLVFLVGPNGAGKSNFVDALRFVVDGLRTTLDHALRERGGIQEVRRRSSGHPTHFAIHLEFQLASGQSGSYEFRVGARPDGAYEVQEERCTVHGIEPLEVASYEVQAGRVRTSVGVVPAAAPDRLYLVSVSGLKPFRPVYEALSHMGFYNLNPESIRALQHPEPGDILVRDGRNLARVLSQLERHHPEVKKRIEEYLEKVVPGIQSVDPKTLGPMETVEFRQGVAGAKHPWRFLAANMSDGTLRVLGILVALFQVSNGGAARVPLVGIEEPELALHPGAAGVLRDSLKDASLHTQVIVTSHSPDLLDDPDIPTESILPVTRDAETTRIAHPDEASLSAIRDRLYTPGELLRLNQLVPDPEEVGKAASLQLDLFKDVPEA